MKSSSFFRADVINYLFSVQHVDALTILMYLYYTSPWGNCWANDDMKFDMQLFSSLQILFFMLFYGW